MAGVVVVVNGRLTIYNSRLIQAAVASKGWHPKDNVTTCYYTEKPKGPEWYERHSYLPVHGRWQMLEGT